MNFLVSKSAQSRIDALIEEFVLACPPVSSSESLAKSKVVKSVTPQVVENALETFCSGASEYVCEQKLSILRRAAFARSVQKGLMSAGYSMDIVSRIINALTVSALVGNPRRAVS